MENCQLTQDFFSQALHPTGLFPTAAASQQISVGPAATSRQIQINSTACTEARRF